MHRGGAGESGAPLAETVTKIGSGCHLGSSLGVPRSTCGINTISLDIRCQAKRAATEKVAMPLEVRWFRRASRRRENYFSKGT